MVRVGIHLLRVVAPCESEDCLLLYTKQAVQPQAQMAQQRRRPEFKFYILLNVVYWNKYVVLRVCFQAPGLTNNQSFTPVQYNRQNYFVYRGLQHFEMGGRYEISVAKLL